MSDTSVDGDPNEVAVLVPAAGEGSRLGGTRKQFRVLGDRPLLVQVLLVFERHPGVGHIVVAAPEEYVSDVSDRLQAEGLSSLTAVVSGGDSRQASVQHALRAVPAPVEVVLVHDAVRPFVTAREVQAVVRAVHEHGAASLALPVADTLRHASGEVFGETVSRDGLYRMQTPQGFRRAWLEEAHRLAAEGESDPVTDDVGLVQQAGREVHRVDGSRRNFKITTTGDWQMAQELWLAWADDPDRLATAAD
jgi:2-C-methyl-D-erythritol 4-phosphate cytidylyltransferase